MSTDLPPAAPLPGEAQRASADPARHTAAEAAMVDALLRLDGAALPAPRPVIFRIGRGVGAHFKLRVSEWFTTAVLLQFGLVLYLPPDIFPVSPGFRVMASWATETAWGTACLAIGAIHLLALTVNGTFPRFRWSPHIRAGASFLACFLWMQITMGIYLSGSAPTGLGTYRLILALEIWNVIRACVDAGRVEGRRVGHGS